MKYITTTLLTALLLTASCGSDNAPTATTLNTVESTTTTTEPKPTATTTDGTTFGHLDFQTTTTTPPTTTTQNETQSPFMAEVSDLTDTMGGRGRYCETRARDSQEECKWEMAVDWCVAVEDIGWRAIDNGTERDVAFILAVYVNVCQAACDLRDTADRNYWSSINSYSVDDVLCADVLETRQQFRDSDLDEYLIYG